MTASTKQGSPFLCIASHRKLKTYTFYLTRRFQVMSFHTVLAKLQANVLNHWRICIALPIVCALSFAFILSLFTVTTSTFAATISTKKGPHTSTQTHHVTTSTHTSTHTTSHTSSAPSSQPLTGTTSNKSTSHHKTSTKKLTTHKTQSAASTTTKSHSSASTSSSSGN